MRFLPVIIVVAGLLIIRLFCLVSRNRQLIFNLMKVLAQINTLQIGLFALGIWAWCFDYMIIFQLFALAYVLCDVIEFLYCTSKKYKIRASFAILDAGMFVLSIVFWICDST